MRRGGRRSDSRRSHRSAVKAFRHCLDHRISVIIHLLRLRFGSCCNFCRGKRVLDLPPFIYLRLVHYHPLLDRLSINCRVIVDHRPLFNHINRYILNNRNHFPAHHALVHLRHGYSHHVGISEVTHPHTLVRVAVICSRLGSNNLRLQHRLRHSDRAGRRNSVVLDRHYLRCSLRNVRDVAS